jgi:hypothetical protein
MEKIAILNGFGRTLGDSIIGLQALRTALDFGALTRPPVLFRLTGLSPVIEALYARADFAEIRELPWSHAARDIPFRVTGNFGRIIDIRDFAFDAPFLRASMIDYFLSHLGLDPVQIPSDRKRNTWLARYVKPVRPNFPADYILVCPNSANELRTMPKIIQNYICETLACRGYVISLEAVKTLEELCGVIAHARCVISTDTATVHLADAFNRPCVAFFPTHDPLWRVRDYPLCKAISLAGSSPPGLEFARGPEDIARAESAWFPQGGDLSWLAGILRDNIQLV